jgi:hypothetical protein
MIVLLGWQDKRCFQRHHLDVYNDAHRNDFNTGLKVLPPIYYPGQKEIIHTDDTTIKIQKLLAENQTKTWESFLIDIVSFL